MEILISPSLLAEFIEGIKKEFDEKKESKSANQEPDGFVSIHAYDMLAQAYDAKFDECKKLENEIANLKEKQLQSHKKLSDRCSLLEKENKLLRIFLDDLAKTINSYQTIKSGNNGLEKH